MIEAAEEAPAAWPQQLHLILRAVGEIAAVGDEELDLLLLQPARQLLPVALVEGGADGRVVADEVGQGFRHQQLRRVGAAAEAQFAGGKAVVLHQFVAQCTAAGQQAAGVLQHQFALAGETEFPAGAVHQLVVEVALQGLDAAAEGGLAEADGVRRANEAAVIGKGDEMA
ncbi:hypothetical protein D3C85_987020 [compost metagenome]